MYEGAEIVRNIITKPSVPSYIVDPVRHQV